MLNLKMKFKFSKDFQFLLQKSSRKLFHYLFLTGKDISGIGFTIRRLSQIWLFLTTGTSYTKLSHRKPHATVIPIMCYL